MTKTIEIQHDPEYFSLAKAAVYLGCSQTTIRRYAKADLIPWIKTYGGHYRFARWALDEFIQEQGMQS